MGVTTYEARPDHRLFDPGRGMFDPVRREPPHGVFRPGKTRQDRMPVDARPRVAEALARREARR